MTIPELIKALQQAKCWETGKISFYLKNGEEELGSIEVDIPFCEYKLINGKDGIELLIETPKDPINLDGYIKSKYEYYAPDYPKNIHIAFIKYFKDDKENICLAYKAYFNDKASDEDPDDLNVLDYEGNIVYPIAIDIPRCEYSIVYDEYLY